MSIIFTFLGIVFALLVAYIFSFNRKAIDIKTNDYDSNTNCSCFIYDEYINRS